MDFATKLRLIRRLRGVRQVQLSHATGLTPNVISLLERGCILPSPDLEAQLLDGLGYEPELEALLSALARPQPRKEAVP